MKNKYWFLTWNSPRAKGKHARFKSADNVANKLLKIVESFNANLHAGEKPYGVMDFESIFKLRHPDGSYVLLEDLPSYVSDDWLAANSEPVI